MSQQIVVLALVQIVAMASPGPTAIMMLHNVVRGGRRLGYATAVGVTASTATHVVASAAGLAELIVRSPTWALGLRVGGAGYLSYLGVKILVGRIREWRRGAAEPPAEPPPERLTSGFREGFLTNLMNPKVTLLYLALFGQLAGHTTDRWPIFLLAGTMVGQSLAYWLLFSRLTGGETFRQSWTRWNAAAEVVFGLGLVGFGIQLLKG